MKKRLVCLLLIALTVMVCTAAMAAGTYSVGTKQERLVNNVSRNESAPESIYYVDWIDNPTKIKATAVNSRVSLSWDPVTAIDLYSIYDIPAEDLQRRMSTAYPASGARITVIFMRANTSGPSRSPCWTVRTIPGPAT